MDSIVQTPRRVHLVRVLTPRNGTWEVSQYGLCRADALAEARQLADLLGRVPTREDADHLRELWLDLVGLGVTPRYCRVELVVRRACAGDTAPHGWETVVVMEPRACGVEVG